MAASWDIDLRLFYTILLPYGMTEEEVIIICIVVILLIITYCPFKMSLKL